MIIFDHLVILFKLLGLRNITVSGHYIYTKQEQIARAEVTITIFGSKCRYSENSPWPLSQNRLHLHFLHSCHSPGLLSSGWPSLTLTTETSSGRTHKLCFAPICQQMAQLCFINPCCAVLAFCLSLKLSTGVVQLEPSGCHCVFYKNEVNLKGLPLIQTCATFGRSISQNFSRSTWSLQLYVQLWNLQFSTT